MQIDRTRFLMLTTSIAAGACAGAPTASPEVPEQTVIVIAPPPPAGPVASAAPVIEEDPVPPQAECDNYPSREDYVEPEDPAVALIPTTPSTCGNSRGNPALCSGLRAPPGPHCESFSDTLSDCNSMRTGLQPRVAEKAVQCLLLKSGKRDICQFDVANKCGLAATKDACIDSFSDQPCRQAVAACGRRSSLTLQRCQQVLSAVAPRSRRAVMSCITEGCSVDYCLNIL